MIFRHQFVSGTLGSISFSSSVGHSFAIRRRIFHQPNDTPRARARGGAFACPAGSRYRRPRSLIHSSLVPLTYFSLYCCSVQQGPVRDRGVQISRQKGRLRLGRHTSYPHPLFQAAETDLRRLCQLHPKVGFIIHLSSLCGVVAFLSAAVFFSFPEYLRLRFCRIARMRMRAVTASPNCVCVAFPREKGRRRKPEKLTCAKRTNSDRFSSVPCKFTVTSRDCIMYSAQQQLLLRELSPRVRPRMSLDNISSAMLQWEINFHYNYRVFRPVNYLVF